MPSLSPRLRTIVDALPLEPSTRVLEIGCGSGAAARAIARRVEDGYVLGIDRSAKAIGLAVSAASAEVEAGSLVFRRVSIEDFVLGPEETPYDVAVAVRVGVLDGRHPEEQADALRRIRAALVPGGRLFIDGGDPLREISLDT